MPHPADMPPPSVGFLVWQLSARWRLELDRALAPLGLTAAQYSVLASLHALTTTGHAPSQRELADFSGLDRIHVSKLVRALEGVGRISRRPHPDDTRAVALSVTDAGRETVTSARHLVQGLEERRLRPLGGPTSKQSAELAEGLHKLLRHTDTQRPQSGRPADKETR